MCDVKTNTCSNKRDLNEGFHQCDFETYFLNPCLFALKKMRVRKMGLYNHDAARETLTILSLKILNCCHRLYINYSMSDYQRSGAAEACWAHNPKVEGSKPSSAISISGLDQPMRNVFWSTAINLTKCGIIKLNSKLALY